MLKKKLPQSEAAIIAGQNQVNMGDDFLVYFQRLEILAFFSGFPFLYSIIHLLGTRHSWIFQAFFEKAKVLLPLSYALTATFFAAYISIEMIMGPGGRADRTSFLVYFLKIWGVMAILFWTPFLRKVPPYSLWHSLVFFVVLLLKDLVLGWNSAEGRELIRNDMKIFTTSTMLNLVTLVLVFVGHYIIRMIKSARAGT